MVFLSSRTHPAACMGRPPRGVFQARAAALRNPMAGPQPHGTTHVAGRSPHAAAEEGDPGRRSVLFLKPPLSSSPAAFVSRSSIERGRECPPPIVVASRPVARERSRARPRLGQRRGCTEGSAPTPLPRGDESIGTRRMMPRSGQHAPMVPQHCDRQPCPTELHHPGLALYRR